MAIIRNQPISTYLSSERISAHKLKTLAELGPRGYYLTHISRIISKPRTPEMVFGSFFEDLIQRPATFKDEHLIRPPGLNMTETKKDPRVNAFKEISKTRDHIKHEEYEVMLEMAAAFAEHPEVMSLLHGAEQQVTLTGEMYGLSCQSRPDWVHFAGCSLTDYRPYTLDLKTTDDITFFAYNAEKKFSYDMQAAMVRHLMEENGYPESAQFNIVVEKSLPHRVAVVEYRRATLDRVRDYKIEPLMIELRECLKNQSFPRIVPGRIEI